MLARLPARDPSTRPDLLTPAGPGRRHRRHSGGAGRGRQAGESRAGTTLAHRRALPSQHGRRWIGHGPSASAGHSIRALLEKLRRRMPDVMAQPFKRQHLVARTLLERWVDASGFLEWFDLKKGKSHRARPARVGFVNYFIRNEPEASERRWSEVENRLPDVFGALDAGTLLNEPELVDITKRCIALHAARSLTFQGVYELSRQRGIERVRQAALEDPVELAGAFSKRTGLYPAGPQALELEARLEAQEAAQRLLADGRYFRDHIHDNVRRLEELLSTAGLEVLHTTTGMGEFLIADDPAPSIKRDSVGVGPLGGVPWSQADTVALPLGPGHLIAVAKVSAWQVLDAVKVQRCNEYLLRNAQDRVFYRPGSGVREFVEARMELE